MFREDAIRVQMLAKMTKPVDEMSDEEVLDFTVEWMALRSKQQIKTSLGAVPPSHVRIQLEALCDGKA